VRTASLFSLYRATLARSDVRLIAKYKCLSCGYVWWESPNPTKCSNCQGLSIRWVNYEEIMNIYLKDRFLDT